jgi:hypothetical protein
MVHNTSNIQSIQHVDLSKHRVHNNPSNGKTTTICHKLEGCPVFRHTVGYKHPNICGGCSNLWYPKAALTPPFRAPAESGQGIMITFSCAYFGIKIDRRIVLKTLKNKWKHLPKSFYRLPMVKRLWRVFAVATLQNKLDHFGPWWEPGRLAFRQPFADVSPIKLIFKIHVLWEDGRVF